MIRACSNCRVATTLCSTNYQAVCVCASVSYVLCVTSFKHRCLSHGLHVRVFDLGSHLLPAFPFSLTTPPKLALSRSHKRPEALERKQDWGGPKGVSNINSAYFIHITPKIGGAKAPSPPPPPPPPPRFLRLCRAGFRGGGGNRGGCPGPTAFEGAPHGAHNNDIHVFFWFIVTRSKLLICVN